MHAEPGKAQMTEAVGLTALVVDDEPVNRMVLGTMLKNMGFGIVEATNGLEACDATTRTAPDIIFMDIMMPSMDGLEATRIIKDQLGDLFVPVIFLTAITDEAQLRHAIEVGGDDFMTKPYSRTLLQAKINAALRIRGMQRAIAAQRDELKQYHERQQRDMEVARRILENIATREALGAANVRHVLRPLEVLNGDLILAATRPTGEQCFMVGDFTGHGLPAAIGAQTAHDVFLSLATKGFGFPEIVQALNRKMLQLLPVDRFLSAVLIELDNTNGVLKVWNGGMPDVLVRNAEGAITARFRSASVPLGIAPLSSEVASGVTVVLNPGDRVLACSDGLIEAHNPGAELFGTGRLVEALGQGATLEASVAAIESALARHVAGAAQSDDIAYLVLDFEREEAPMETAPVATEQVSKPPGRWQFAMTLDAAALKRGDPVATVIQVMEVTQGLGALRTPLFMVLNELFSNALEHGLLKLDSSVKRGVHGFADYYELREQRLAALSDATLDIDCRHEPEIDGGRLHIRVAHDGQGFEVASLSAQPAGERQLRGRGVALVHALCESLDYADGGREARAVYRWTS